jgi:glutathione S-transferase
VNAADTPRLIDWLARINDRPATKEMFLKSQRESLRAAPEGLRLSSTRPALRKTRMATDNRITLYDLQLASGCTISPFVWRTKYALAHKGFDLDIVPAGFTGILERTGGRSERVPVIVDDGEWVLDSWVIAEYLDEKYPDRPMLFEGPSMKVLTKFIDGWLWRTAIGPWFRCYILDYHDLSLPQDQNYVRWSREQWFLAGRSSRRCRPAARIACHWCRLSSSRCASCCAKPGGWVATRPTTLIFPRSPYSVDHVGRDDTAPDRGRSAARLARPRLPPVRRARPPPRPCTACSA